MDRKISRLKKRKLQVKTEGNLLLFAKATKDLADFYFSAEYLDEALEEYLEEAETWRNIGDELNRAIANRMIGETYTKLGKFEKALKHLNLHLGMKILTELLLKLSTEGAQKMRSDIEEQRAYAMLGWTHFCFSESFSRQCKERTEILDNALKAYTKAIQLCDQLKGISKEELKTMQARLLLNVGLVLEAQNLLDKATDFIKKALKICSDNKLSEDLQRAHLALVSAYEKQGNIELSLNQLDSAVKDANETTKTTILIAKSEFLLKIGEWIKARKILVDLYRDKTLPNVTREQVEKLLRIAVTICRGEKKLIEDFNKEENNSPDLFKLYEKIGDAATAATCYKKALEYYEKMLYHAEKYESNEGIASALVSLSRTFKDAKRYEEALIFAKREFEMCSDPSEACRSALFLADLSESAGQTITEISNLYKLALSKAETSGDPSLEYSVLKDYLVYLENNENHLSEAENLKERLIIIEDKIPRIESEVESLENFDIDDEILLDELSDLEEEEEEKQPEKEREMIERQKRESRKRKKGSSMKKNEKGETPLHVACINGNIEIVEKLIDNGHPINVQDNAGWTPLHEAANHGFVEIARLLINAGANISDPGGQKTGGITPLHDAASCGEFSVINLLMDKGGDIYAVTKNGETILDCLEDWRSRAGDLTAAIESEYKFIREKLSSKGVTRKRDKKHANGTFVTDKRNRNRVNLIEDSDEDCEEKGDDIANISAGEDYKRTIAVLRNRGAQPGPSTKFSPVKDELPPLIDSEQILADEWLEDDIGVLQNVNKKRNSWNEPLSTTKRKNESAATTEERERKRQKVFIEDDVASLDICDDEDEEEVNRETDTVQVLEPPAREPTKFRKSKRQISLLSVGFSRDSESRTPSPVSEIIPPRNDLEEEIEIENKYLNLNVVIDRRTIELRLHISDEKKIIAENVLKEVEKKFEEDTGCFPRFQLVGPHDIILSSQDLIEDFSSNGNSLNFNTVIRDMNVPLISERYGKICAASNVDVEDGTLKCLKICENTSKFRLRGRHTLDNEIPPLLKSLEYETRLQTLRLSSVDLNEMGKTLNRCLSRLDSLQELQLRSCDIDTYCLSEIENFPLEIRMLDLSYNPLGKEASIRLHELLSPLKVLQTLNLGNCELEEILPGTSGSSVIRLDISGNPLGGEEMRHILQAHMISLNASGSQKEGKTRPSVELLSHPLFSFGTLESLELSSCDLCDSDLSEILSRTANLTRLVVNGNSKLSNEAILQVLRHTPTLSYIDVSGCSKITDEPPDNRTYHSCADISTLVISMVPGVQQAWLRLWNGEGSVQNLPYDLAIFKRN